MDLDAVALSAVQALQAPAPPAAPPAHLQGLLAQAGALPHPPHPPPPQQPPQGLVRSIVFRAPSGAALRSAPGFLSSFCGDVRASRSEAEFSAAVSALRERLHATGAYKGIGAALEHLPQQQQPSLVVTLDEASYRMSGGGYAGARGEASASADFSLINALGYAESLSVSVGREAPLSLGVGGADGAGAALGGLLGSGGIFPQGGRAGAAASAASGSSSGDLSALAFRLEARKPSLAGTPASLGLLLRSSTAPLSSQCPLSQRVLEGEATATDASGVHSLAFASALRSLAPLRCAGQPAQAPTLNSPQTLEHCLASVKNSVTYAAHASTLAPCAALPASGASGALRLEVAGLGGDARFAKASLAGTWAASLGRYMPDTGYSLAGEAGSGSGSGGGGALRPFPGAAGLLPWAPRHWASERLAAWLSPGVTLALDGFVGALQPLGRATASASAGTSASASHLADRFFLPDTGRYMRGFAGLGQRGSAVGGAPGALGDALGADALATVTARLLLPPPLPVQALVGAGLRTYAFASLGAAALHGSSSGGGGRAGGEGGAAGSLGALALALAQRPSASFGVGLVSGRGGARARDEQGLSDTRARTDRESHARSHTHPALSLSLRRPCRWATRWR